MIEVVEPGPLTTVQDTGRPGHAALGVSPSGAADLVALRLANRLVANHDRAAALEVTLGGLVLRFGAAALVAVTGAPCPVTAGARQAWLGEPIRVRSGETFALGRPPAGLRSYVAVRGGIAVPAVLGSRSTDVLGGLGPAPLSRGDLLPVGPPPAAQPSTDLAATAGYAAEPRLAVLAGPRADWFTADATGLLCSAPYTVQPDSDRVALRLSGPALRRAVAAELPSEGLVRGAVQVPPDGRPVVFLADHPTTGGYPVLAVVRERDHGALAQLRPGQRLRFTAAR